MIVGTPAKRRWADVATITIIVGEAKTAFQVHEADLFEASPVFRAAFHSDFRESTERTMTLPEDDETIFELFVDWLYCRGYEIPLLVQDPSKVDDIFMQPVQLFVLADKYDVRELKSLVLSKMFRLIKLQTYGPDMDTMAYAYENTAQNSAMRGLIADYLGCIISLDWYKERDSQTWLRDHPDISTDAIVSFAGHSQKVKNPFRGEMLYMHKEQDSRK